MERAGGKLRLRRQRLREHRSDGLQQVPTLLHPVRLARQRSGQPSRLSIRVVADRKEASVDLRGAVDRATDVLGSDVVAGKVGVGEGYHDAVVCVREDELEWSELNEGKREERRTSVDVGELVDALLQSCDGVVTGPRVLRRQVHLLQQLRPLSGVRREFAEFDEGDVGVLAGMADEVDDVPAERSEGQQGVVKVKVELENLREENALLLPDFAKTVERLEEHERRFEGPRQAPIVLISVQCSGARHK
jgi:hypothetical protein